jgi:hypothetical protein
MHFVSTCATGLWVVQPLCTLSGSTVLCARVLVRNCLVVEKVLLAQCVPSQLLCAAVTRMSPEVAPKGPLVGLLFEATLWVADGAC